jgi:hypothetical protein
MSILPSNKSVQATAAFRSVSLLWFLFMCPFCRPQSLSAAVPDLYPCNMRG